MRETNDLLQQRYGNQEAPEKIIWNDQTTHLLAHRSVRKFLPAPLPEGAVETMVAAAQSASTSTNLHQWSVVVVEEPERRKELMRLARSDTFDAEAQFIADASGVFLWVADLSRNRKINHRNGKDATVFEHLDSFLMSSVDASLAAQNAAVAAESIGLGVTYLGSMRNNAAELAEFLNLPNWTFVVFGMAVGTPDPERRGGIRPRPEQSVVLHRERYDPEQDPTWLDRYEEAFHTFRTEQNMKPKTWTESVLGSTEMSYMDGRENLRQTVQARGFKLR